ncbi:hypothetical protein YC2023_041006 [Brassica napus]|uniref:(rape) hypothetical protein n=1 Tax=Brassica napus TaxID=3708 RepID=A0A816IFU3_BRANA|nr:unnamed protein product [Brassica napus]
MVSPDLVESAAPSPWKSPLVASSDVPRPAYEVSNGVAALDIPEEVFASLVPLWKAFVVGYFIGEAPHVGSIHATVNRIWTTPGGLKCLSSPVGKFVKLHPFTELCSRLDVAQMLLEVNLHEPLVESVTFTNQECYKVEVGVSFPWFPTRCNICSNWGHKGPECNTKQVVILSKSTENKTRENEIGENEKVEGELEGDNEVSLDLGKDAGKNGNSGSGIAFVGALLAELETLPAPILQNEVGTVQSASNEEGVGKRAGKEIATEEQPEWNDVPYRNRPSLDEPEVTKVSFDVASGTISPSRFKVLETLNEEEEGLVVLE